MKKKKITILFPCVGRRVSLLRSFRRACGRLGYNAELVGTDTTEYSPALQSCDQKYVVKPVAHRDYAKQLFEIVNKVKVDLLVPTVDLDLPIWANHRNKLAKIGCTALISSRRVIDICQDKRQTFKFLTENNFETPLTLTPSQALRQQQYPYFLKPWDGHASRGNALVHNREELRFYSKRIPNCLVQKYVPGKEHTIDVFVDFDMKVRSIVVRRRIETRAGEVSKGVTVKDLDIIDQSKKLVECLGAGPGIITIQCFVTPDHHIKFIEVNPRFGGGVPLSIKAGANFPRWILQLWLGQNPRIGLDHWQDNLTMLRYDDEIWVK